MGHSVSLRHDSNNQAVSCYAAKRFAATARVGRNHAKTAGNLRVPAGWSIQWLDWLLASILELAHCLSEDYVLGFSARAFNRPRLLPRDVWLRNPVKPANFPWKE